MQNEAALVDAAVVARYVDVATTCLVFYDWITMLADEVNLVWKAPSRPVPRYIFLILRYTTLAAQPVALLYDFFQPRVPEVTCPLYVRVNIGLTYVVLACSELIIMLRLLSAYRSKPCVYRSLWGAYVGSMLASAVVVGIWNRSLFFQEIFSVSPGPGLPHINLLPGCWTVFGGKQLLGVLGILIAWELGIGGISFWRTWTVYVSNGTPFWDLFFQSGNHFYAWILGISWINIGLVGATLSIGGELAVLDRIVLSLTRTVHSVCVAHLLLHVRRQSGSARALEEELAGEQMQSFPLSVKSVEEGKNLTERASIHDGKGNGKGKRPGSGVRSRWEERKKRRKESLAHQAPEGEHADYDFDYDYPRFAGPSDSILTLTPTPGTEQVAYPGLGSEEVGRHTEMEENADGETAKERSTRSHDELLDSGSIRTMRIAEAETENRPRSWMLHRKISKSPHR